MFEKFANIEELEMTQKQSITARCDHRMKKGRMEEIKSFVIDIGLKHKWGRLEIFLLEQKDMNVLSIKGFATSVSEQDLSQILNDATSVRYLYTELQKHLVHE